MSQNVKKAAKIPRQKKDNSPLSAFPPLPSVSGLGRGLEGDTLQHRLAKMPFIGGQPPPRHIMP